MKNEDISRDLSLTAQLAEMERRWKRVRFYRGAGHTLLVLLLALAAGAGADYSFTLSMLQRGLLTLVCYATVASFAWFGWLWPFLRPLSPGRVAWMLEKAVPDFNEKLISAVELSQEKSSHISMDLIHRILEETETDLLRINPQGVFPLRWLHFLLPGVAMILFLSALAVPNLRFGARLKRVAFPSAYDATVGRFELVVMKPLAEKFPEGEPIHFAVRCSDPEIRHVELCTEEHRVQRSLMTFDAETGLFLHTVPAARRSMTYWAQCGEVVSRKYDLEVLKRPAVEQFTIRYVFPDYMGLVPSTTSTTAGEIKAYRGTRVELAVKSSQPLAKMTVEWLGEKVDAPLNVEGSEGKATFTITRNGNWSVRLRDTRNLENLRNLEYAITALDDTEPVVTLDRPGGNLYLEPEDKLELAWTARDDFGIRHQELRYSANKGRESILVLEPTVADYSWMPDRAGIPSGDELEYYVRVYDGAGHHADSARRSIFMVHGSQLKRSGAFIAAVEDLRKQLAALNLRVGSMSNLQETVRAARRLPSGMEMENLEHNLNLLGEQRRRMALEMESAERECVRLKDAGFFPRSQLCGELMGRYIRQGRLFETGSINGESVGDRHVEAVAELVNLSGRMTAELAAKAGEQVSWLEALQMDQTLASLVGSTNTTVAPIRERFAERARRMEPGPGAARFQAAAARPKSGLRGEYFDGLDRYVQDKDRQEKKPKLVRTDSAPRFGSSEAFGVGVAPFAVEWNGYLNIAAAGRYTFVITSDDGARLYVDGQLLVNNDGTHGPQERTGAADLDAGLHTVQVSYFNAAATGMLALDWIVPGQPRCPVPPEALFEEHPDALAAQMRALQLQRGLAANDFAKIDKLAAEIRDRLRSLEEAVADLAREQKLYDQPGGWEGVKAMAADLRKQAAETGDAEVASDLRLAADALEDAAEKKDSGRLTTATEALADMERYHDLKEWKADVDANTVDARRRMDDAQARLEKTPAGPEVERQLEQARSDLSEAQEVPVGDRRLREEPELRPLADTLAAAAESVKKAGQDARDGKAPEAVKDIDAAERSLDRAGKMADDAVQKAADERSLARETLNRLHEGNEKQLAGMEERLAPLAARLKSFDPENRKGMEAAADQVQALEEEWKKATRDLEKEAGRELAEADGDVALARDRMAVAAELERIGQERIEAAREALDRAAAPDAEANADESRQRRAGQLATAVDDLQKADSEMKEARELLAKAEAAARDELPHLEESAARAKLDRLARERLEPAFQKDLERLEAWREGEDSLRRMARVADRLEEHPNREQAAALARESEDIRRRLESTLTPDGRQAFLERADDVIDLARQALEKAMSDTRAFRAEDPAALDLVGREKLAERIRRRPAELEPLLAKAEAMGALLDQPGDGLTDPLHKRVEPAMAQASQKVTAQQSPDAPLGEALAGMKAMARQLEGYSDAVEAAKQGLQNPAAAAAGTKPSEFVPMRERVDRMQDTMARARAAENEAERTRAEVAPHELKAAWLLDQAAEGEWDAKEKAAIEKARNVAKSAPFDQRAQQLEAVAKMVEDSNPELARSLKESGQALRGDHAKVNRATQLQRQADEGAKQMAAEATQLDGELARSPDPALADARENLDTFRRSLKREDLEAADRNLDALATSLDQLHARAAERQRETGGDKIPETIGAPAAERLAALNRGDPSTRLGEMLRAMPELKKAGDQDLDWNGRRGLMELGADAMRSGQIESADKEAATAASTAEFGKAAEKTRGEARERFQQAADSRAATAAEKTSPPPGFDKERPDAVEQALAAAKAAEFEKADRASREMDAAVAAWNQAGRRLDETGKPFEEAFQAMAGIKADGLAKGEQKALAQQQEGFEQAGLLDKAERMENAARTIKKSNPELREKLEKAAEAIRQDPKVKEAAQEEKRLAEAAGDKAAALDKALDGRETVAAARAREALASVRSAVKAGDHRTATAGEPAEALKEAMKAMDPARPLAGDMNDRALDAAAAAQALENKDALAKAARGDHDAAADSMRQLAEALPEGKARDLAKRGAEAFKEAREVGTESMPRPLADAVRKAEANPAKRPAAAAAALKQAANAARAGDLERASELMPDALAGAPREAQEELKQMQKEIDAAARAEAAQLHAMPDDMRQAVEKIADMKAVADPVARNELQKAEQAALARKYDEAAGHMALASLALPESGKVEQALDLAGALAKKDKEEYGPVNEPARAALEALEKNLPDVGTAARSNDYARAEALARQAGEREAAEQFSKAARGQLAALAPPAQQGLAMLQEGEKRAPADRKADMQEAARAALNNDLRRAEELARRAVDPQAAEAAVAAQLQAASQFQKNEVAPLEKAVQELAQNQPGRAAMSAAESGHGQPAAEQIRKAMEQAQDGAEQALKDGLASPDGNAQAQLAEAARKAMANDLNGAVANAAAAGKTGEAAKAMLEEARKTAELAKAELQKDLEQARKDNAFARQAEQGLAAASQALKDDVPVQQKRQQSGTESGQALRQAAQAVDQNQLEQAGKLLARAPDSEALGEQLDAVNKGLAQAAQAAETAMAATEDAGARDNLKQAAELARKGDAAGAQARAAAAGQPGQAAAESMAQAGAAKQALRDQMQQAAAAADRQAASAAEAARMDNERQAALGQVAQHMKAGNLEQAARTAREASRGAYEASQAAEMFAAAQKSPPPTESPIAAPGEAQTALPAAEAAEAQAGVADAMGELQMAENDLDSGRVMPRTTDNLEEAAAAMNRAAQAAAQAAMGQLAAGKAAAKPVSQPGQPGQKAGQPAPGGGGGGRLEKAKEAEDVPEPGDNELAGTWAGVEDTVTSDDRKGHKMQYSDYYRKANQRYLEKIQQQARQQTGEAKP